MATFDDLPDEAAVNIFSRLPVKTLIRSTSVSKTWYSRITNPHFISAQIKHSLSCFNENAVFVVPTDTTLNKYGFLMSANTGDVLKRYKIPFKTKTNTLIFHGSFNGILCFTDLGSLTVSGTSLDEDFRELYLWNPCVGKYRTLFSSCFKKRGECSYALGLGVYEPTFDFRLVRVVYTEDDMGYLLGKVPPKVEVFSLGTNKWRRIKNPVVPKVAFHCGITVGNNMTYWLDTKRNKTFFDDGWLVSFDFNNEVFGTIKLPYDVRFCLGLMATFKLMMFEGKLAVCVINQIKESNGTCFQPCCIWLMSHDNGEVSWTLRFKVVLKERLRPISLSRGGTLLIVSTAGSDVGLVSCNLMSEDLRQSKPLVTQPGCADASFVESLLMLEGRDGLLNSAK